MPSLRDVERGWQQPCEIGETERWSLGTGSSQRGEEDEGTSSVAMATKESGRRRGEQEGGGNLREELYCAATAGSLPSIQAPCL